MKVVLATDGAEERMILSALCRDTETLARLIPVLHREKSPFRNRWCNLIASWCVRYYSKYQKAPESHLALLFKRYADSSPDKESVQTIEAFLYALQKEKGSTDNQDFIFDTAVRYFACVQMERLADKIRADCAVGKLEEAQHALSSFEPLSLQKESLVPVFGSVKPWIEAVSQQQEELLVRYPGALGEFFGPHLCRDALIGFMAPEKRGKSWWLLDVAWRSAVRCRRRTLFYSVGDMSMRQVMRRLIVRAIKRPLTAGTVAWPRRVEYARDRLSIRWRRCTFRRPVSQAWIKQAFSQYKYALGDQGLLRLKCTPNGVTKVADIIADVQTLSKQGWVPDVIVIDYADILAPEFSGSGMDVRHQINETWKALRRLSQEFHVLVVTATQTNAASYEAGVLRRSHFSEDKRKLAHVTGMVGINQTAQEKQLGVFRLNWIVLREAHFLEERCVTAVGALALSNPAVKSAFK